MTSVRRRHKDRHIVRLPPEIVLLFLDFLDTLDLCRLALTCSSLHQLVRFALTFHAETNSIECRPFSLQVESYWTTYNRLHPHPSPSLHLASTSTWSGHQVARHNHLSDRAWERRTFSAKPLPPTVKYRDGGGAPRPLMATSDTRLIVFAGRGVESLRWTADGGHVREGVGNWQRPKHEAGNSPGSAPYIAGEVRPDMDVTGLVFLPDGGKDEAVCLATADGQLVHATLSFSPSSPQLASRRRGGAVSSSGTVDVTETAYLPHPLATPITTLVSSGSSLLTLASRTSPATSTVSLSTDNPATSLSTRETLVSLFSSSDLDFSEYSISRLVLPGKPTSAHLSLEGSYAAIGTSQKKTRTSPHGANSGQPSGAPIYAPLSIHAVTPHGIFGTPLHSLTTIHSTFPTSYALCAPSPSSPLGASPHLLLSGWFDSYVHLHDLRQARPIPVISWHDPWLDDAVYSLSSCTTHVVAGMGQHGIIAIFDFRSTGGVGGRNGFSAYSPEGDGSPVYAIHAESSRVWGLNKSLFLLDFGPGAVRDRGRELFYEHSVRYITQA